MMDESPSSFAGGLQRKSTQVDFKQKKPQMRPGQEKVIFTGNLASHDPDKLLSDAKITVLKDYHIEDGAITGTSVGRPGSPQRGPSFHSSVFPDVGDESETCHHSKRPVSIIETSAELVVVRHEEHPWTKFAIARTVLTAGILLFMIILWALIPEHAGGEQHQEPVGAIHHTVVAGEALIMAVEHGPTRFVRVEMWLPMVCPKKSAADGEHAAPADPHADANGRLATAAQRGNGSSAANVTSTPTYVDWRICGPGNHFWLTMQGCKNTAGHEPCALEAEKKHGGHRLRPAASAQHNPSAPALLPADWYDIDAPDSRVCYALTDYSQDLEPVRLSGDVHASALRLIAHTDTTQSHCETAIYGEPPNGLTFSIVAIPQNALAEWEPVLAGLILVGVYVLIVFELIHRTITAMVGSFMALTVLAVCRERVTLEEVVLWIDLETVCLLFGMMIMVTIAAKTGFFELAAVRALKISKGSIWLLTVLLCVFTAIASAFLDNVTTMLLMTPVSVRLASLLKIDPRPLLLAQVLMSNVGGTATPVGDPPNIIIINNKDIVKAGISFMQFSVHMGIGVLICMVTTLIQLRFMLRNDKNIFPRGTGTAATPKLTSFSSMARWMKADWDENAEEMMVEIPDEPEDVAMQSVSPNDSASISMPSPSRINSMRGTQGVVANITESVVFYKKGEDSVTFITPRINLRISSVKGLLAKKGLATLNAIAVTAAEYDGKIAALEAATEEADQLMSGATDATGNISFEKLEEQYKITNMPLFVNCCLVLGSVVAMFFLHSGLEGVHLSLAWTALAGAMTILLLSNIHDFDGILEHVEWSTLLFFAALFVLMEALQDLGLIGRIGQMVVWLIQQASPSSQLLVAILVLLWVSAFASAFIDNIPYTLAMVPIVVSTARDLNLPLRPLVWALGFGACMGGNGTLIGASANVVTAGLAEGYGFPVSFNMFFKTGFPVMIQTIIVITFYLIVMHVFIGWNES